MIREEVLKVWNNLKKRLSQIESEYQEYKIPLSKLKLADWKTYAKKAYLINGYEGTDLSETVSRWNQKDYYKIVNNPSEFKRKVVENIITKWKVTTVKCLVIEEKNEETLAENIFNPPTFEEIKEKIEGVEPKSDESYDSSQKKIG